MKETEVKKSSVKKVEDVSGKSKGTKKKSTAKKDNTVKSSKKVKKEKLTIGETVFRTVILVLIFFIILITYIFYLGKITQTVPLDTKSVVQSTKQTQ